jgi:hypothetical protein
MGTKRVLIFGTDHSDFEEYRMVQMRSFQGSPVLCFFNKRLFEATVRANDMVGDLGF